jgi:hypothetical protein
MRLFLFFPMVLIGVNITQAMEVPTAVTLPSVVGLKKLWGEIEESSWVLYRGKLENGHPISVLATTNDGNTKYLGLNLRYVSASCEQCFVVLSRQYEKQRKTKLNRE